MPAAVGRLNTWPPDIVGAGARGYRAVDQEDAGLMSLSSTGIYKIGDRRTGTVTYVLVVRSDGQCLPMRAAEYLELGIKPAWEALHWRDDWLRQRPEVSN